MQNDYNDDELIDVRLSRKKYELMKQMIEREEAFNWIRRTLSASVIWIIAGGLVSLFLLWEKFQHLIVGNK